jgi:hypothetical protein
VAVAQVPVCWSVPRNLETILAAIGGADIYLRQQRDDVVSIAWHG